MTGLGEDPKIGPYSLRVPPPSLNGSRVDHGSLDPLRQAIPGLIVALVLALSAVPKVALTETSALTQWWRLAIAALAGGLSVGILVRRSWPVAAVLGATANTIALFIAYGLVREQEPVAASASTVAADLSRLLAWAVAAGTLAGALGYAVRGVIVRRIGAHTAKPVIPRSN